MGLSDLSVGASLFGDKSQPGLLGTGQQRFQSPQMGNVKRNPDGSVMMDMPKDSKRAQAYLNGTDPGDPVYETDPYKAWQDPNYDASKTKLADQQGQIDQRRVLGEGSGDPNAKINRNDIERYGGAQIDPIERARVANIGQIERGQQAQLAAAERSSAQNIGQANVYGGAQIDPAAQARAAQLSRQDQQFRSGQTGLMSDLQEQAAGRGPSLAEGQLRQATDRNLAQQAGMAAAGGGSSALAQRQLATGAAQANQQAGRDAAQMRMQEQLSARQQLQGVTQTGREQDINVANAQAQLQQQTSLANAQALNTRAGQQAGLTQQAGLAGSQSLNDRQLQQAQMNQANNQFNATQGNQFALQQGQFGQQMNLANMQAFNQRQMEQAGFQQQANLTNAQSTNQRALAQSQLTQQAGLANQQYSNQSLFANQQAALQNQQMNDAMNRYYTEAGLGLDARQQQAMMAFQTQQQQSAQAYAGLNQKAYEAAREGTGAMTGGVGSIIGMAAMSDEEVKNSITKGNDSIGDFLSQYKNVQELGTDSKSKSGGFMDGLSSSVGAASMLSSMSDNKVKDLSAENKELKKQMEYQQYGDALSSHGKGKGLVAGFGSGMSAGAKSNADKIGKSSNEMQASNVAKTDPSIGMTPVMSNPNAAIAMPGGMNQSYGGLPVRENPYAQQTWSASPDPVYNPPPAGNTNITHMDPYATMQTWSDKDMKSYSPAGMKTGIGSGDMSISKFLSSMKDAGSGPSDPTDYGSMSDESTKKLSNFLDSQHAYDYEYKDKYKHLPGAGEGRYVSPMAQDLQKTDLGKSMVKPGPDGKLQVDYAKGFGTILASQAYLNDRLNEIESKKGKR